MIVDGVFAPAEIDSLRNGVIRQKHEGTKFSMLGRLDPGLTIPDFMARREFDFMHHLPYHAPLHRALHRVFRGQPYRYCSHNDIGVNRIVGTSAGFQLPQPTSPACRDRIEARFAPAGRLAQGPTE